MSAGTVLEEFGTAAHAAGIEPLEAMAAEIATLRAANERQMVDLNEAKASTLQLRQLLRDITAVAITTLYQSDKADVVAEFSLRELNAVLLVAQPMQAERVVRIYRRGFEAAIRPEFEPAHDALAASPGSNAMPAANGYSWQQRVYLWLIACFGAQIAGDVTERNFRFGEEALELLQAGGCTLEEVHTLAARVYSRPVGEVRQELGGMLVTAAALACAWKIDMEEAAETELARIWECRDQIRAKHERKPKNIRSPLPGASEAENSNDMAQPQRNCS